MNTSTVKIGEGLDVTGTLKIDLVYPDRVVSHFKEENLIVLRSKQIIIESLYLPNRVSDPIIALNVGVGGCIDPQAKFPKKVNKNLSSLYSQVLSVPTNPQADLDIPQVTFLADVDQTQCNGMLVNEAGLFTVLGRMFNIKTFPGIPKTEEFSIHFEWTIDLA